MRVFFVRCGLLSSLLLLSAAAHAQERDPAAAEELFRQGRAASEQRDFRAACAKFRESNRLDPAVGTVFNIADCEEKLGRLATSWTLFQEVVQRLPSDDERRSIALKRARELEPRLPMLTLHLSASGRSDVSVRRDGVELGSASMDTALPVDPGEHLVVVSAPGTRSAEFRRVLREAERAELQVAIGGALPAAQTAGTGAGVEEARPSHTAAYAIGGAGLAGLLTGVVAGLLVLDRKSTVDANCKDQRCNQAGLDAAHSGKIWGLVTTFGLVSGALGLGTAGYLFVSAPTPLENARSSAYLLGIRAKW